MSERRPPRRRGIGLALPVAVVILAVATSGCVSPGGYFADRWNDAKDIFTATVGVGAGAKARVGPINAGLFLNQDYAGLRGGECFNEPHGFIENGSGDGVLLLILGGEIFDYQYQPPISSELYMGRQPYRLWTVGDDLAERNKSFTYSVFPRAQPRLPATPYYYTQLEAAVGLWGSLRLGFNPGELVDFLLGWTTLDLFGDDLVARLEREAAEEKEKAKKRKKPQAKLPEQQP